MSYHEQAEDWWKVKDRCLGQDLAQDGIAEPLDLVFEVGVRAEIVQVQVYSSERAST